MKRCKTHYPIMRVWKKIKEHREYFVMRCPYCGETIKIRRKMGLLGGQKVNAIFEDKHGNQIAVNKKGNVVENKYKNDSRGWKRAGKKIANYDAHNNKLKENYR